MALADSLVTSILDNSVSTIYGVGAIEAFRRAMFAFIMSDRSLQRSFITKRLVVIPENPTNATEVTVTSSAVITSPR